MRSFVGVFVALLALGLVAVCVVVAPKVDEPVALTGAAAGVPSSQNTAAMSDKGALQLAEAMKPAAHFAATAIAQSNTTTAAPAFSAAARMPKSIGGCN